MAKRRKKKTVIRTPFPTVEKVRRKLGVSKKRAKQLEKMVDRITQKDRKK